MTVDREQHVRATYRSGLTLLAGLVVALVLAGIALNLVLLIDARTQRGNIQRLLERQDRSDAASQQLVEDAVSRIAAAQTAALEKHDAETKRALQEAIELARAELLGAASQEQP